MSWMLITTLIWAGALVASFCSETYRELWCDAFIGNWAEVSEDNRRRYGTVGSYLMNVLIIFIQIAFFLFFLFVLPFLYIFIGLPIRLYNNCLKKEEGNTISDSEESEEKQKTEKSWAERNIRLFHFPGKIPFDFDRDCYIYVENHYDERINRLIEIHWEEISEIFQRYNFRFIYIPRWKSDTSALRLANLKKDSDGVEVYLTSMTTFQYVAHLCKVLHFDFNEMESGIFHFAGFLSRDDRLYGRDIDSSRFTLFLMTDLTEDNIEWFFTEYCKVIENSRSYSMGGPYMSVVTRYTEAESCELCGKDQIVIADYKFPVDMKDMAENVKREIEALKEGGYYELLLHTLGSGIVDDLKGMELTPSLSRMQITDDFKIWLTDYDKEVRLTPLQKTLYLFYLRHPEGVEFKHLSAYYDEILNIYQVLSNREDWEKQKESVRRLVDVTDNAINEKCSRIKEAFLSVANDFIACNYYITLQEVEVRSEGVISNKRLKRVTLPRELVSYPTEIAAIKISRPQEKIEYIENRLADSNEWFERLNNRFYDKSYPKGKLVKEFTDFINSNSQFYAAYSKRAVLYTHIGMYREAIADNQVLIDHDAKLWSSAIINKAEALFFLGQYEEALKTAGFYFEKENEPDSECYRIRAEIYKKLQKKVEYKADMKEYKRLLKEEDKSKYND